MMNIIAAVRSNIINLANECSLYTKSISVLILIFYGLSYVNGISKYVSITPGYFLPPNYWVFSLLTFSLYNTSVVFMLSDICTVFLLDKLLMPLWGWLELVRFCLLVNLISALLSIVTYYLVYLTTFNINALFATHIHGLISLLAALTVAGRQLMPDNVLLNMPLGKFRNKHLSFTVLFLFICLKVFHIIESSVLAACGYGIFVSWLYLRFYQLHSNGNRGDMGDTFTFAGFFPNHLEPPVAILANTIFSLFVRIKLCKKADRRYDISSPTTIALTVTTTDPADAERRKQLALKALNDRLNKVEKSPNWPSLLDDSDQMSPPAPDSTRLPGLHAHHVKTPRWTGEIEVSPHTEDSHAAGEDVVLQMGEDAATTPDKPVTPPTVSSDQPT